jgi:hypothetical protein
MEIQLVRESWGENDKKGDRWVDLYVGADGSARLSRHDLRPSLEESSDDEDYEYHVNVPAAAVPSVKRKALNFGGDAHPVGQSGTWKGDATESLADIRAAKSHVRITPEADMCGATRDVGFGLRALSKSC